MTAPDGQTLNLVLSTDNTNNGAVCAAALEIQGAGRAQNFRGKEGGVWGE